MRYAMPFKNTGHVRVTNLSLAYRYDLLYNITILFKGDNYMAEKVIYYRNLKFVRDDKTGYYLNSTLRVRLHRYVWACERGDIPKGYEIHHIDFDRSNNDISNLLCLSRADHRKLHADALTDEQREWKRQNFETNARPKANEWHRSEEGRRWHQEHANTTAMHNQVDCTCINCGIIYRAITQSKFCSNKCKSAYRRKQHKDVIPKICVLCGKEFLANKYRPQETCSKSCATKLQHKRKIEANID